MNLELMPIIDVVRHLDRFEIIESNSLIDNQSLFFDYYSLVDNTFQPFWSQEDGIERYLSSFLYHVVVIKEVEMSVTEE